VRGISLKLQEEERERRMDFVPDVSAVQTEALVVDPDTKALLSKLGMAFADSIQTQDPKRAPREFARGPRRE
jgi:small subunit ribosomal protein S17e